MKMVKKLRNVALQFLLIHVITQENSPNTQLHMEFMYTYLMI